MNFNPRAPCGARRERHIALAIPCGISIHAPLAGRDTPVLDVWVVASEFQSTRPLRGATSYRANHRNQTGFQSTRPLRGATSYTWSGGISEWSYFNPRAPCGARRGISGLFDNSARFQSTRPLRGATRYFTAEAQINGFQSTRPLRGATSYTWSGGISEWSYFNPRAPCGARRGISGLFDNSARFQSTRPLRGATRYFTAEAQINGFQSTRPLRGATLRRQGVRLLLGISIHAPLAGRDHKVTDFALMSSINFNPRAPCGARPGGCSGCSGGCRFQSTRPLRGATSRCRTPTMRRTFQSTRPLRGATVPPIPEPPHQPHFNPRAPCGARPAFPTRSLSASSDFNPRAPCGARRQKRTKIFLRFCDNRQIPADFSANHRLSKRFTSAFQKKRGRFPVRSSRQFSARLRFARDDHCHSERSITPSVCRSRRTGDALRPR